VSIYLNNGAGGFGPPSNVSIGDSAATNQANPIGMAAGDFNLDGKPDLVVANYNQNNVSVLLGLGNGNFQAPLNMQADANPHGVAIGDFNGDGKPDFVVPNYNSSDVSVFYGYGDGTFHPRVNSRTGTVVTAPTGVTTADLNGDNKSDFVISDDGGNLFVFISIAQ
jgi:hypothetical protein